MEMKITQSIFGILVALMKKQTFQNDMKSTQIFNGLLLALVCGVAASYRTLKRGSVVWSNTVFIYFSLTFQIFARIFSLGLFFFTVRDFMPTIPILLRLVNDDLCLYIFQLCGSWDLLTNSEFIISRFSKLFTKPVKMGFERIFGLFA